MHIKYYELHKDVIAGITLLDENSAENNSMALHCCNDPNSILKNRSALAASLKRPLETFICANQTHSKNFYKVTMADLNKGSTSAESAISNTDALFSFENELTLTTFTADCVPILFYESESNIIGAIHSGWKGTIQEVSKVLMEHLKKQENCNLENMLVLIGPALSQNKFEVDEDVYEQFHQLGYADDLMYFNKETSKYHINNQQVVKKQLELAGVASHNITVDETCTFTNNQYFSYRQNRTTGRHLSFITKR